MLSAAGFPQFIARYLGSLQPAMEASPAGGDGGTV